MPRNLILGTAGHIDHGKTSLVKALTGIDCDRLPEEKARGITIDIGFATLDLGDYRLGIVDVPGHERFIKNMLADATIVRTSAQTGEGIAQLKEAIAAACAHVEQKTDQQWFRMAIDRSFIVQGHGTVVTGSVTSGQVRAGDEVDWL